MSTFASTQPAGGVRHLTAVVVTALAVCAVSFGGFAFLIDFRAAANARAEIAELREKTVATLVAAEKKALPKGSKPDDKALKASAEQRLGTDAKVKEKFEKDSAALEHHAVGGLFPLACFVALASGVLGGLFGAVLLVKRTKDAALTAWPAFLSHFPSFAFYMLLAFLPVLGHLAHEDGVSVIGLIRENGPVEIGAVFATVGLLVNLVLVALPSRKGRDDGHDHGESCACAH